MDQGEYRIHVWAHCLVHTAPGKCLYLAAGRSAYRVPMLAMVQLIDKALQHRDWHSQRGGGACGIYDCLGMRRCSVVAVTIVSTHGCAESRAAYAGTPTPISPRLSCLCLCWSSHTQRS